MLKVLIADKDNNNITGIRSYIDINFHIFKIKGAFNNERDFFKYLKAEKVDLIILEIRFLGIEFYKKIKEFSKVYKDTKFIVYGSLSDLDYMKKCIDIGAIAYIIRPVKPSDLKKSLNLALNYFKSVETFKKEEKMLDMEYVQNFKLFEDKFLSVLIKESIFSSEEIEKSFEYFNINIESPYTVAVFRIDSFRKHIIEKSQKEKHFLIFRILKIIKSNIENSKAFINLFNEVVVILGGQRNLDELLSSFMDIKLKIKEETGILVSCGIGRGYEYPNKIHTSFLEAITALRYRCIVGYNSIIAIEYVEKKNNFTASYPYEREKLLVYTAVIGEYDYCIKLLDDVFKEINNFKEKFEEILPQIIMSILIGINRNAFEQGLKIDHISNFFPTKDVLGLKTTEQAYSFMKHGLKEFCLYICNLRKNMEDEIFEKSIDYISERYYENITYKSMARNFNCNFKYFKKIFEDRTEKNIKDYIERIRIDKAKQMILETNLTDDVIALKIGYDDVNVFRKTFKKLEGRLAGDFRYISKDLKK